MADINDVYNALVDIHGVLEEIRDGGKGGGTGGGKGGAGKGQVGGMMQRPTAAGIGGAAQFAGNALTGAIGAAKRGVAMGNQISKMSGDVAAGRATMLGASGAEAQQQARNAWMSNFHGDGVVGSFFAQSQRELGAQKGAAADVAASFSNRIMYGGDVSKEQVQARIKEMLPLYRKKAEVRDMVQHAVGVEGKGTAEALFKGESEQFKKALDEVTLGLGGLALRLAEAAFEPNQ